MYTKSVDFHQCIICNENKVLQALAMSYEVHSYLH